MTAIKPIVPHHLHPSLRHMPQRPLQKFLSAQSHPLHLPVPMILVAESHPIRISTRQPLVRDRSPFDVAGKVSDDSTAVAVALPDAHIPILAPQFVEKVL